MRTHRWFARSLLPLAVAAAAAPMAVAAPSDDLVAALAPITEPHRTMLDAHARLTVSGVNRLPVTVELAMSARAHVQNVHLARWDVDTPLASAPRTVFLDGTRVIMRNTAKRRYERMGTGGALVVRTFIDPGIGRLWPSDLTAVLEVSDRGVDTVDGVQARHLHARLAPAYAETLLDKVVGRALTAQSGTASTKGLLDPLGTVTFPEGALDLWIGSDGRVWRRTIVLNIRVASKGAPAKRTIVEGALTVTEHPYDVGVPLTVRVPRPVAASVLAAETMDQISQIILWGAADAPLAYRTVIGSYSGLTRADLERIQPLIRWTRRTAAAARNEVQLVRVRAGTVTLATRSPTGRTYAVRLDRDGRMNMTCRTGRRSCPVDPLPRPNVGLGALAGLLAAG